MTVSLVVWVPVSIVTIAALLAAHWAQHCRHEAERAVERAATLRTLAELAVAHEADKRTAQTFVDYWQRQAHIGLALCQHLRRHDGDEAAVMRDLACQLAAARQGEAEWRAIADWTKEEA